MPWGRRRGRISCSFCATTSAGVISPATGEHAHPADRQARRRGHRFNNYTVESVPAGVITEEMLSAHDWYKTFAAFAGASAKVPTDRPLDGIDASKFLVGESEHTGREDLAFFGPDGSMMSAKWLNIKIWL